MIINLGSINVFNMDYKLSDMDLFSIDWIEHW